MVTIDQDNWVSEFDILLYQWKGTYKKGHIFQQALIFNTPIRKRLLNCDHFSVIFACISLILSGTRYSLFMIVIIISMVISWIPGQQISRRQIVYNLYSELQLKICGELSGSPFVDRFQSMKIWWQSKSKWCKSIGYNKLRKLKLFNRTLYCTSYKQAIHISAGLHPFFLPLFTND